MTAQHPGLGLQIVEPGHYTGRGINLSAAASRSKVVVPLEQGDVLQMDPSNWEGLEVGRGVLFASPTDGINTSYGVAANNAANFVNQLSTDDSTVVNGGPVQVVTRSRRCRMKVYIPASFNMAAGTRLCIDAAARIATNPRALPSTSAAGVVSGLTGNVGNLQAALGDARGRLLAATAASATITNTVAETAFDNSSVVIPANTLQVGDVLEMEVQTIAPSTNSTDTLTVRLKAGSTVLATTGAVDVANNDIGYIKAKVEIRTIGASGTAVVAGIVGLGVEGTVTAKPFKTASFTIDTTAAITLSATAQWSVASGSNQVRADVVEYNVRPVAKQIATVLEAFNNNVATAVTRVLECEFLGQPQ